MDEQNNERYRGSGAASRPPESDLTEDTPLFTDIPYTAGRRTPKGQMSNACAGAPAGGR